MSSKSTKENIIVYLILIVIGLLLLTAVYFASRWSPLAGALVLGVSVFVWLTITPRDFNSDPAGDGMEAGFDMILNIIKAIVLPIVFYISIKNNEPDSALRTAMIVLILYFTKRLIWMKL
ncbi:MAG: hypothetical protein J6T28_03190 [Paludibacteraceae bacterium]|nr:hypothetical protein [Paludibacteraceae bacterium]